MYSLVPICEIQLEILINESAELLWLFVIRSDWRVASFNLKFYDNSLLKKMTLPNIDIGTSRLKFLFKRLMMLFVS